MKLLLFIMNIIMFNKFLILFLNTNNNNNNNNNPNHYNNNNNYEVSQQFKWKQMLVKSSQI